MSIRNWAIMLLNRAIMQNYAHIYYGYHYDQNSAGIIRQGLPHGTIYGENLPDNTQNVLHDGRGRRATL